MKKILQVSASLLIVLLFTSVVHSIDTIDPRNSSLNSAAGITYIVDVQHTNTSSLCNLYYVMVTNENGEPVDQPKVYVEGVTTYVFHEDGPINETRTAHLTKVYGNSPPPSTCNQTLYATPMSISSSFRNGSTYMFYLNPSLNKYDK